MKTLKIFFITLITVFTFGGLKAQVIVRKGPQHPRKVVIVKKRYVHHHHAKRPVVVVKQRNY